MCAYIWAGLVTCSDLSDVINGTTSILMSARIFYRTSSIRDAKAGRRAEYCIAMLTARFLACQRLTVSERRKNIGLCIDFPSSTGLVVI